MSKNTTRSLCMVGAVVFLSAMATGSMMGFAQAQRGQTSIALGETSAPAPFGPPLRQALTTELGLVEGVQFTEGASAHYIIRGSVTRLDERRTEDRAEIECEVSLIVADRASGNVRFVLEGRAAVRGPRNARLRRSVVRAAVRGALRPLSTTL